MKNLNKQIKDTSEKEVPQFSFESKFKFKTLHLNYAEQKTQEDQQEEKEEEQKVNLEIDQLKDIQNQTIEIKGDQIKDYYKLDNISHCTVKILGKLKTLYLSNIKDSQILSGIVETSIFGDHIENSKIQAIAQ